MNEHDVVHDGDERIYHHAEKHDVHDLAAGGPVRPEVVEESGLFLEVYSTKDIAWKLNSSSNTHNDTKYLLLSQTSKESVLHVDPPAWGRSMSDIYCECLRNVYVYKHNSSFCHHESSQTNHF